MIVCFAKKPRFSEARRCGENHVEAAKPEKGCAAPAPSGSLATGFRASLRCCLKPGTTPPPRTSRAAPRPLTSRLMVLVARTLLVALFVPAASFYAGLQRWPLSRTRALACSAAREKALQGNTKMEALALPPAFLPPAEFAAACTAHANVVALQRYAPRAFVSAPSETDCFSESECSLASVSVA